MKKVLLAILAIISCVLLLTACDKAVVMNLDKKEVILAETEEINNDSDDPMKNFYSFHFKIGEDILFLPMTYGDLYDMGWTAAVDKDREVLGSIGLQNITFSKDGDSFVGSLVSSSDYYVKSESLILSSAILSKENLTNNDIVLPKEISITKDTKETIEAKAGDNYEKIESEDGQDIIMLYSYDVDENIAITIDRETEMIKEINIFRYIKTKGFEKTPDSILEYVRTDILSDYLENQTFAINESCYMMPVPVEQLIENGFVITSGNMRLPNSHILESGDSVECLITDGDLKITAVIENFFEEPTEFEHCFVTYLVLNPLSKEKIEILPNLNFGSAKEDLLEAISPYEVKIEKLTSEEKYIIDFGDRKRTIINFDTLNNEIKNVELVNYPK